LIFENAARRFRPPALNHQPSTIRRCPAAAREVDRYLMGQTDLPK
jgi:hypothetical protein